MGRRSRAVVRVILPDPKFNSTLVSKFINCLMLDGKKSISEKIFYGAMEILEEKSGQSGVEVFQKAVENVKPSLEVKSRRVGGATYQVPVEVRVERRATLAIRWLISYARDRHERTMRERLASEFWDASQNQGSTIKKKIDTHKMAEANKAFAHYRW